MDRAEYLKRAEDCERLAALITSSESAREKILKIATGWRELAKSPEPNPSITPRAA